MASKLHKILRTNYTSHPSFTHVSLVAPLGRYGISRKNMDEFWDSYEEFSRDSDKIVGLAEKPRDFLPVLGDIDIKVKSDKIGNEKTLYTEKELKKVVQIYQSVLRKIVEKCTDKELMCVVLEKDLYKVKKNEVTYVKNGFHLHFPNVFLSKVDQEIHLVPRIKECVKNSKMFSRYFEDSGSVIDDKYCRVPWLLYGSRKNATMSSYLVSKIYNSECCEISLEEAFSGYKIYDSNDDVINLRTIGDINKNLPRILSINPANRPIMEIRDGLDCPSATRLRSVKKCNLNKTNMRGVSIRDNLKTASILLKMLSDNRVKDYGDWLDIGFTLYNISEGSQEGLDLWLDFSSRIEEVFDEAGCIYQWEKMTVKSKTIGSLHFYAKKDNIKEYEKYTNNLTKIHCRDALNGSHNDIAKALHKMHGNEFVCSSISSKKWYQFRDHIWEEIEEGVFLRERISRKGPGGILQEYLNYSKEQTDKLGETNDKAEEAMYNSRIKQCQKMLGQLKSSPYKNNIMKECQEVFYDRLFFKKLNQNKRLIAFKNGVYDLDKNIFRDGRPDDYISKCVPIEYKEFSESDDSVLSVHDFLEKIFPDLSVRKYFMDVYSEIFEGGNPRKIVVFWTGEGNNGKSVLQRFFEKMLGDLAIKFETTLMTGKKVQTGCAAPELARAAPPVRHAVLDEPGEDETLNTGYLKKLSGDDCYYARDLFEKGKNVREIHPQFMLTFICNNLPKMKQGTGDKATWNRIRVIPFESTFEPASECPTTFEEQLREKKFPVDEHFGRKIPGLLQAFAWVLLEHRKKPGRDFEPAKVKEATEIYRKQNDIYRQFEEECIIRDERSNINVSELYSHFKEWFKEGFPQFSMPTKNIVKEYFLKKWGECERGGRWPGIRIRNIQDDIDSGKAIVLGDEDMESEAPPL